MNFTKNSLLRKTHCILVLIYFSIFNYQLHSQVMPEWMIFNTSNSPLSSNNVYNIAVDNFNNKWIAAGGEVLKISGDDFTDFSNWTPIPDLPANVAVIQADQNGNLWMGSGLGYPAIGLIKYNGNTFTIYNTQNSPLPYNLISGIAVDLNNNIWIMDGMAGMTSQIYLVEFDQNNGWFQLPGNFGYETWGDLAGVDSSDNIWTASEFKLTSVNTITHQVTEWDTLYLGQYVTEVKPDFKGNIWIAGGAAGWGGLARFDGQNFTYFDYYAYSLAVDDQKNLWVGTEGIINDTLKLLKYDGTNWFDFTQYNSPLPGAMDITNLEFDKNGNLWIATSDSGIAVYKAGGIVIPVELTSFRADAQEGSVVLNWTTATETNNKGFDVERNGVSLIGNWEKIGFVSGSGTTTEPKSYTFTDNNVTTGNYLYRLKQIDFDGSFKYSNVIEVTVNISLKYSLEQNYPNPFNPTTKIEYSVAEDGIVILNVYNTLGQKVADLVNGEVKAGTYEVNFDASKLSSGVYYYKIEMNGFVSVKKMMLLR